MMSLNYSERVYCPHPVTIFNTHPTDENIKILATSEGSSVHEDSL